MKFEDKMKKCLEELDKVRAFAEEEGADMLAYLNEMTVSEALELYEQYKKSNPSNDR